MYTKDIAFLFVYFGTIFARSIRSFPQSLALLYPLPKQIPE